MNLLLDLSSFEVVRGKYGDSQWVAYLTNRERLHFSTPQVPHMGYLGYLLVISPILGYLFLSTNEGELLYSVCQRLP